MKPKRDFNIIWVFRVLIEPRTELPATPNAVALRDPGLCYNPVITSRPKNACVPFLLIGEFA
jgi:hypothetical protein